MKIGIILGTFDPIHMSHTLLASTILNLKLVDKVYFVPTVQNPWKINHPIASFDERCSMIKKSVEGINKIYPKTVFVEDIEGSLMPPYYSYKTLDILYEKYDGDKNDIYIIGGADVINSVSGWLNFEKSIKNRFKFIGFTRGNEKITNTDVEYILINADLPDISSTLIRSLLSEGLCAYPYISESIIKETTEIYKNCNDYII